MPYNRRTGQWYPSRFRSRGNARYTARRAPPMYRRRAPYYARRAFRGR